MKFSFSTILFALALALAPQAATAQTTRVEKKVETQTEHQTRVEREARSDARQDAHDEGATVERTSAADGQAVVSLCLASGDVLVRGWERAEVRARAEGVGNVRLLTPNAQPAPRVEVLVSDNEEDEPGSGDCGTADQVELMVPRGATVNVRTQNGHVDVSDVSDARVEALSGDVDVRHVTKAVLISCLSGDVSVSDVSGPVRAITVSGSVEARNARSLAAGDRLEAKSTSGDVTIENVKHTQVIAATVSGNLLYTGSLARGGAYDLKTISGDVTMEIQSDSSFELHAKVVVSGDIDTDFSVKTVAVGTAPPQPTQPPQPPAHGKPGKIKIPKEPEQVRLDGTVGTGDATVTLSSFSGSLHLRKQ